MTLRSSTTSAYTLANPRSASPDVLSAAPMLNRTQLDRAFGSASLRASMLMVWNRTRAPTSVCCWGCGVCRGPKQFDT
jgi:hypothetical protein